MGYLFLFNFHVKYALHILFENLTAQIRARPGLGMKHQSLQLKMKFLIEHENCYLVGGHKCGWEESTGWGDEQILGLWGTSWGTTPPPPPPNYPTPQPLSPIPPVGKTLQVAFKKHGLHSMPQGLRVSCKTYFLF